MHVRMSVLFLRMQPIDIFSGYVVMPPPSSTAAVLPGIWYALLVLMSLAHKKSGILLMAVVTASVFALR